MKSLKEFINENKIRVANCEWVDKNPNNPEWRDANHFKVTLKRKGGKQISTFFSQGYGCSGEPDATSVLNCLALDSSGIENNPSYEDWASEYGYDEDSRQHERIYKSCVTQANKVKRWLGEKLYEELLWDVEGI